MNKFIGNCEGRPDASAGTVKILVRLGRTAHIIAWEFIRRRVGQMHGRPKR